MGLFMGAELELHPVHFWVELSAEDSAATMVQKSEVNLLTTGFINRFNNIVLWFDFGV